jgi:hypothetical protein
VEAARQYGAILGEQVISAALARWRDVSLQFQNRCTELLGPFLASTANATNHDEGGGALTVRGARTLEMSDDWWTKVKAARSEFMHAAGTVGMVGGVLTFVIATSWFPPLAVGGAVAAGLWGLVRGWNAASINQIKDARQVLHRHLAGVLQEVRKHFFDVNLASGHFSRVDEYFQGMERSLAEHIAALAKQRLEESQAEISRLMEELRLDQQERKARAEQTRQQIADWDGLGTEIVALQADLKELDQSLQPKQPT